MPLISAITTRTRSLLRPEAIAQRVLLVCAAAISLLAGSDLLIKSSAEGKVFSDIRDIEPHKVALVLGCRPGSYHFIKRISAAAELYHSGKAKYLLVSGDNSRAEYDEPSEMLYELVRRGVPSDHIVRDYAGFRTLDSVIRAKKVFHTREIIIVSQRFHLERALFLAQQNNIEAVGYYNDNWQPPALWTRERLARLKAVFDTMFNISPKFLGKKITIGTHSDTQL